MTDNHLFVNIKIMLNICGLSSGLQKIGHKIDNLDAHVQPSELFSLILHTILKKVR